MAELDARRSEVLGNAARTIQLRTRTYMTRKQFIALREASITMQSYCRGTFLIIASNQIPGYIQYIFIFICGGSRFHCPLHLLNHHKILNKLGNIRAAQSNGRGSKLLDTYEYLLFGLMLGDHLLQKLSCNKQ